MAGSCAASAPYRLFTFLAILGLSGTAVHPWISGSILTIGALLAASERATDVDDPPMTLREPETCAAAVDAAP